MSNTERLANLAASLKDNEALTGALAKMRENARDALCAADPRDASAIQEHQVTVKVIDDLLGKIDQIIRSGTPRTPPGIA